MPRASPELMAADPVTVAHDAVLSEAAWPMDEHGVRHLPVVRGGVLVGVVSDRGLLEPAGKLVPRVAAEGEIAPPLVRDAKRSKPFTVSPEATVATAAGALVLA